MNDSLTYEPALSRLKEATTQLGSLEDLKKIVQSRDEVLGRYRPIFTREHIPELTEQEFRSFLLFENNRHWSGLHRSGPKMCADMTRLRSSLSDLLDEGKPIEERLDRILNSVPGMGKAIATAILQVAYPDRYGIWNSTSESGLRELHLWPKSRGDSMGQRYAKINHILRALSRDLQLNLWNLDALWWGLWAPLSEIPISPHEPVCSITQDDGGELAQSFGLERHLHEFLRDNWDRTSLGREWKLYSEPGDEWAGYEYHCGIGRIDLLAYHRTEPVWLVVELKRDQASDATMGQVLCYIGWVKNHLAEPNEEVKGLVIAHKTDDALRYALSTVSNVDLQLYEVDFRLKPTSLPGVEK